MDIVNCYYYISVLHFKTKSTNVQEVVEEIAKKEPLITSSRKEQVVQLVQSRQQIFKI